LEHDSIACVREEIEVLDDSSNDNNRHRRLFRTLSGSEILQEQGIHLIRVPTIEAILNRRWFVEQIETLLKEKILSHPKNL
jgi:hypothetical protein